MPNLKNGDRQAGRCRKSTDLQLTAIFIICPCWMRRSPAICPYIVRTDWLEKLGIESPVTLEDWENYWHLVKTTDLNGNGSNDEVPFSSYDMTGLRNFCTAFGCLDDFYTDPDDGGKVHYGPIDPKYKEAVTWMHDMYEKGYIDPGDHHHGLCLLRAPSSHRIPSAPSTALWVVCWPPRTPPCLLPSPASMWKQPCRPRVTAQIHSYIDQEPRAIAAATITASCKNVDRVVALLDYMYSAEGTLLINMGIEGTHYTMQNGKPIFTDYVMKNPDGLSPKTCDRHLHLCTELRARSCLSFRTRSAQLDDDAVLNRAKQDCIIPVPGRIQEVRHSRLHLRSPLRMMPSVAQ